MGVAYGHGHKLRGFVAGEAEHHSLVPGAGGIAVVKCAVNAEGDVGGLGVNGGQNGAGVPVEAGGWTVVARLNYGFSRDFRHVDFAACSYFSHYRDHSGGAGGFTGDPRKGVFFKVCVEHCVGNLVAEFIRVPFGYGFGGKEVSVHFLSFPPKKEAPEERTL